MKNWNKQRDIRKKYWSKVPLPKNATYWYCSVIKLKLQQSPKKGKFYIDGVTKEAWFQDAKDATWFALIKETL